MQAKTVYVATGSPEQTRFLLDALRAEGYLVESFEDGLDLYARTLEVPPAAVVCTAGLPGLEDVALACLLGAHARCRTLPVLTLGGGRAVWSSPDAELAPLPLGSGEVGMEDLERLQIPGLLATRLRTSGVA